MAIRMNKKPIGEIGLNQMGGRVYEENLKQLSGVKGIKAYKEMRDNNAIIGAMLFAIKMLTRQAGWHAEAAESGEAEAEFLDSCMDDMSLTWKDFVSEILSMLPFGWSYFEILYKYRKEGRSKYTDGKIGWRKFGFRAQETLSRWEFDQEGGIAGMYQWLSKKGEVFLPIEKSILFRTEVTKNSPEARSIFRNAYRSWYFLKRIQEIEAIGIERDLAGLPVLEVPPELLSPNATEDEKKTLSQLESIVSEVRRDEREGLIIPAEEVGNDQGGATKTGYKFSLASTGGKRQFDTDKIIKRYETRIAMTVLAEFIMMGIEKGSYSAVKQKNFMFSLALDAWLDDIAETINRFAVKRLWELNGFDLEKMPKVVHDPVQQISLNEIGEYINRLSGAGMPLFPDESLENELRRRADLPDKDIEDVL